MSYNTNQPPSAYLEMLHSIIRDNLTAEGRMLPKSALPDGVTIRRYSGQVALSKNVFTLTDAQVADILDRFWEQRR